MVRRKQERIKLDMDIEKVKPHYNSSEFEEYCEQQKLSGLREEFWEALPEMWESELEFRELFEKALDDFVMG